MAYNERNESMFQKLEEVENYIREMRADDRF